MLFFFWPHGGGVLRGLAVQWSVGFSVWSLNVIYVCVCLCVFVPRRWKGLLGSRYVINLVVAKGWGEGPLGDV